MCRKWNVLVLICTNVCPSDRKFYFPLIGILNRKRKFCFTTSVYVCVCVHGCVYLWGVREVVCVSTCFRLRVQTCEALMEIYQDAVLYLESQHVPGERERDIFVFYFFTKRKQIKNYFVFKFLYLYFKSKQNSNMNSSCLLLLFHCSGSQYWCSGGGRVPGGHQFFPTSGRQHRFSWKPCESRYWHYHHIFVFVFFYI